jgi:hypothetical protein
MDPLWIDNPLILIDKHRLTEIIPTSHMSLNQKNNALLRFILYFSILLVIFNNNLNYIYIFVIASVLSYMMNKNLIANFQFKEDTELQYPTEDNPFMNVLLTDCPDRAPAADITDPEVEQQVDQHFNNTLYRNVNDIWGKNNSQRQFYTNPSTTIPNDRDSFMKWCYNTPYTCKEGNSERCLKYEDPRNSGQIF